MRRGLDVLKDFGDAIRPFGAREAQDNNLSLWWARNSHSDVSRGLLRSPAYVLPLDLESSAGTIVSSKVVRVGRVSLIFTSYREGGGCRRKEGIVLFLFLFWFFFFVMFCFVLFRFCCVCVCICTVSVLTAFFVFNT